MEQSGLYILRGGTLYNFFPCLAQGQLDMHWPGIELMTLESPLSPLWLSLLPQMKIVKMQILLQTLCSTSIVSPLFISGSSLVTSRNPGCHP